MISERLATQLQNQLEPELAASHSYLAMASWAEAQYLPDIARYFYLSAQEEREHFETFYKYINDYAGVPAQVPEITGIRTQFANILELFEHQLTLEVGNTENIRNLTSLALEEKEYGVFQFLGYYNQEQMEAVKDSSDLVHYIRILGHEPRNAWFFNKYMRKAVKRKEDARGGGASGASSED